MHTDETLKILDETTRHIGIQFRAFTTKTCPAFCTRELDRETKARKRRQLQKVAPKGPTIASSGSLPKTFNMQTYKYHALGDYADTIRMFGTSDSYSTEPVSTIGK
jgi:fructose-1-phosphate kinase PfkB-like protein